MKTFYWILGLAATLQVAQAQEKNGWCSLLPHVQTECGNHDFITALGLDAD